MKRIISIKGKGSSAPLRRQLIRVRPITIPVCILLLYMVFLALFSSTEAYGTSSLQAADLDTSSNIKVIRFGKLWDGTGKVFTDALVVVENDRIVRVGTSGVSIPDEAQLIDLRDYTGIPGLIDVHTHMTYYWDQAPGTNPWDQLSTTSPVITVFLAQENARQALETGVTTVRDLGAWDPHGCVNMDIDMRELIKRGAMVGPRMFVSGYGLLPTLEPSRPGVTTPPWATADGVTEVIRAVRQQMAAGADWVKVFASTGTGDDVTGYQILTFEEIKAAVEVAHQRGKPVSVHSYGPEAAREAVRAGADSIEHATDMDDETISEMAKKKIFYVPTIDHNRYYIEHADEYGYTSQAKERLKDFIERNLETARRAHQAGVPLAMGSDAVFTMFGENTRELSWFVKAGLTPEEALLTATKKAAVLLRMEDELGAVAPGYYADIVAVEGDPLTDIQVVIHKVKWVMKGGQVVVDKTK